MKALILIVIIFLSHYQAIPVGIDDNITVGGLSSGAFMAVQVHVALSKTIKGAAVFAGGPYYCAEGSLIKATTNCMSMGLNINLEKIKSKVQEYASQGKIDDPTNLKSSSVFVFSGTMDYTVNPKVNKKTVEFYKLLGVEDIESQFNLLAAHTMPTVDYGALCTVAMSPFIGKCNYNGAQKSLKQLYKNRIADDIEVNDSDVVNTNNENKSNSNNLFKLKQNTSGTSMGEEAYVYVPEVCQSKDAGCSLHVVFHGCKQTIKDIQLQYVQKTGYNEVAEASRLVILYPQAVSSSGNPNGCWDWWGYIDENYSNKKGPQIAEVESLINQIKSGEVQLEKVNEVELNLFLADE